MKTGAFDLTYIIQTVVIGGIFALLLALYFIVFPLDAAARSSMLHLGALEEMLKFLGAFVALGFIGTYAFSPIGVALGFGVAEAGVRFVVSDAISPIPVLIHLMAGILMAIFISKARSQKERLPRIIFYSLALVIPALFHLFYNTTIVPYLIKVLA